MSKGTHQEFLNEAIRIGEELLSRANHDEHGLSWKTMTVDEHRHIIWRTSEHIYSGVSGIVLFLVELHKQTQNVKYLDAALEGMRWVEHYCQNNPGHNYAFFTGRMGVCYTMMRMFDVTKESRFLDKALIMARPCSPFLNDPDGVNDLINGTAGALLGLLHLHAATGEKWLREAIRVASQRLIDQAHQGPVGLYWDRSAQQIRGLCGFSHGAAGVGLVFLELSRYFREESFAWIAEQAFLYESHFYDPAKKNWPDLRKGIFTAEDYQQHEKAFLDGNVDFFTRGGDMNAWCHGAAGIGLSRLRAYEELKKPLYADEVQLAIEKTRRTDIESTTPRPLFILCHGSGGNAELFLQAYRTFGDEKYLSLAETVATNALTFKKKRGVYYSGYPLAGPQKDTSLFMGNAGIGYFYLRLIQPLTVPSILAPTLESPPALLELGFEHPEVTVSKIAIKRRLIEKIFRRTLCVSEHLLPKKMRGYLEEKSPDSRLCEKERFINYMETIIPTRPRKERRCVSEVFSLELEKIRMDDAILSNALLFISEKVAETRAEELIEKRGDSLAKLTLKLNPAIRIRRTGWNWSLMCPDRWIDNLSAAPAEYYILLKPSPHGIIEQDLLPFSYTVLTAFQKANQVENAIQEVMRSFEAVAIEQEPVIKAAIIEQIKQAVRSDIFWIADCGLRIAD
jgi:hypothetical protein